jgi:hypothetical protein
MTHPLALTQAETERWIHACTQFDVDLRKPDPDETILSDSEIWHGIRCGDFGEADLSAPTAPARAHAFAGGAA